MTSLLSLRSPPASLRMTILLRPGETEPPRVVMKSGKLMAVANTCSNACLPRSQASRIQFSNSNRQNVQHFDTCSTRNNGRITCERYHRMNKLQKVRGQLWAGLLISSTFRTMYLARVRVVRTHQA